MAARRSALWTGAALVALALSALASNTVLFRQAVQGDTRFTRLIPAEIGGWQLLEESPASRSEIVGLETSDIVKRSYVKGGQRMDLVVAYIAHSSRKSAHAQEACLRGAGAMVGSIAMVRMKQSPVQAKVISIDLNDRRQWVYYWYKMGDLYTAEYLLSSLKMFLHGLTGKGAKGTTLIRLLTPEGRGEPREAIDARMEDFARNLLPHLEKNLP